MASFNEVCTALGKSRTQLTRLIAKGMPVLTQGSKGQDYEFNLDDCLDWYTLYESTQEHQERIDAMAADAATEKDADIKAAKLYKVQLENQRLEIKLQRERGEVVPIDAVADVVSQQFGNLRAGIFAMPNKVAPLIAGTTDVVEIDKILTDYITECLHELNSDAIVDAVAMEDVEPK